MKSLKPAIVNTKASHISEGRSHNKSFKSAFAAGKIDADKEGARSSSTAELGSYTPHGKREHITGARASNLARKSAFTS